MNKKIKYNYYIIYATISFVDGKKYVGWHATNNLEDGYLGSGKYIKAAIQKHGKENFKREIIEYCNEHNVLEREIHWVKTLDTKFPNGYNLTIGGDGKVGFKASEETRIKMRNAQLGEKNHNFGKRFSEEIKEKMKKPHAPMSAETKQKLSNTKRDKKLSKEHRKNISNGLMGHTFSKESIEKITNSNKNKKRSPETRERMRLARLGKKFNKELKCFV